MFKGGPDDWSSRLLLLAALAVAVALVCFVSPALAQEGGSWRTLDMDRPAGSSHIRVLRPPVCQQGFATEGALLNCLRGQKWGIGYYVDDVGPSGGRKSIYGVIYEQVRSNAYGESGFSCSGLYAVAPTGMSLSGATCYRFRGSGPSHSNFVTLVDGAGNELNNNSTDNRLYYRNRSSVGFPECSISAFCGANEDTYFSPGISSVLSYGYFPNVPPDEPDDACVDAKKYFIFTQEQHVQWEASSYGPVVAGTQFDGFDCRWEWRVSPQGFELNPSSTEPCTPFIQVPGSDASKALCYAVGLHKVAEQGDEPDEATTDSPLVLTVGRAASETDALRVPDIWLQLFGWGSDIAPEVHATVEQLPLLGEVYKSLGAVTPEEWELIQAAAEGGYLDFALAPLDNNCTIQEFYHPGNYTSSGKCLGAFDRDQGKQDAYDPKDGWCWGGRACVELENPAASVVVIDSPVPSGTPSAPSETKVVTADSFELNGVDVNYPPGVVDPHPNGGGSGDGGDSVQPPIDQPSIDGFQRPEGTYDFGEGMPGSAEEAEGQISDMLEGAEGRLGLQEALEAFKVPEVQITGPMCFEYDLAEISGGRFHGLISQCIPQWFWDLARFLVMLYAFLLSREIIWGH